MCLPYQLTRETKAGGLPGPKHLRQLGQQSKPHLKTEREKKKKGSFFRSWFCLLLSFCVYSGFVCVSEVESHAALAGLGTLRSPASVSPVLRL